MNLISLRTYEVNFPDDSFETIFAFTNEDAVNKAIDSFGSKFIISIYWVSEDKSTKIEQVY